MQFDQLKRRDFIPLIGSAATWPLAACDHSVRTFGRPNTYAIAFSPDGRTCLSGAGNGSLMLWDLATGKVLLDFFTDSLAVNTVAFSPDGRTTLSGGNSSKVKLWDIATGKRLRNFWDPAIVLRTGESNSEPHAQWAHFASVTSVAFSPDGRSALSGSWSSEGEDAVLKLWEVATGKPIRAFTGQSQTVQSVAFSLDGLTALSGSPLRLWDVATGKELRTLTPGGKSVAFSPRWPDRANRQTHSGGRGDGQGAALVRGLQCSECGCVFARRAPSPLWWLDTRLSRASPVFVGFRERGNCETVGVGDGQAVA